MNLLLTSHSYLAPTHLPPLEPSWLISPVLFKFDADNEGAVTDLVGVGEYFSLG